MSNSQLQTPRRFPPRGGRYGKGGREKHGGRGTGCHVAAGLAWLRKHQEPDGRWDADEFDRHCKKGLCDGPGSSMHDVGLTGLALLAFLGDGHHHNRRTRYQRTVRRGIEWLIANQVNDGADAGLIGKRLSNTFLYDHALASLALTEAFLLSQQEQLRAPSQRAVNYILRARNLRGGWRYAVPPNGESDSSVSGWMVFVLKTAQDAGLVIDPTAYLDSTALFDELTDPNSGRCGYRRRGGAPARPENLDRLYPAEQTESLTAVALLCRLFMGERPDDNPVLHKTRQPPHEVLAALEGGTDRATTCSTSIMERSRCSSWAVDTGRRGTGK